MGSLAVFPSANAPTTITVTGGRTYTLALQTAPLVVPDFDGYELLQNGWLAVAKDGAGTTAQRPAATPTAASPYGPGVGFRYWDSSLSVVVIWNGKNWISEYTGLTA